MPLAASSMPSARAWSRPAGVSSRSASGSPGAASAWRTRKSRIGGTLGAERPGQRRRGVLGHRLSVGGKDQLDRQLEQRRERCADIGERDAAEIATRRGGGRGPPLEDRMTSPVMSARCSGDQSTASGSQRAPKGTRPPGSASPSVNRSVTSSTSVCAGLVDPDARAGVALHDLGGRALVPRDGQHHVRRAVVLDVAVDRAPEPFAVLAGRRERVDQHELLARARSRRRRPPGPSLPGGSSRDAGPSSARGGAEAARAASARSVIARRRPSVVSPSGFSPPPDCLALTRRDGEAVRETESSPGVSRRGAGEKEES